MRCFRHAHMKPCASRAFKLTACPNQGHEMLSEAHTRCSTALGGRLHPNSFQAVCRPFVR